MRGLFSECSSARSHPIVIEQCGTMVGVTYLADVAELADALDSGSSGGNFVEVQVLSSAPNKTKDLRPPFNLAVRPFVTYFVPLFFVLWQGTLGLSDQHRECPCDL